jgi:hypothetical protein
LDVAYNRIKSSLSPHSASEDGVYRSTGEAPISCCCCGIGC